MTRDEQALLLTVARILRGRIKEVRIGPNDEDDIEALTEALKPFDALPGPPRPPYEEGTAG